MNMTDQIIDTANANSSYCMKEKARQTSSMNKKKMNSIYNDWYDKISIEVHDSEYASDLLIRDILVYNYYESIAGFIHQCFIEVNSLAEIEFRENASVDFDYEYNKIPIVKKHYDFSMNNKDGVKVTNYLSKLFLLREIREKLGFDVNRYPGKCSVIAFEFENVIYVWENGHDRIKRLTIDHTANEEILKVFIEIFCKQTKFNRDLYSMLEGLPFIEGKEGQKAFDIIWYRRSKQTPLTYRCFPNTHTIDFSFPLVDRICRHKGEYCIKSDKIDLRYERFLDLYCALDQNEKEELILNTIDYFNKFLKTDCFDKPNHMKIYLNILNKLKHLNKIDSSKDKPSMFSNWGDLSPELFFPNIGNEISNLIASNRNHPSGPNWDLINADIQETKEANKIEQFEIQKRAFIEAMREINATPSNISQHNIQEENVLDNNTNTITVALIDLQNNTNPNNDKLDATHFIGFMNRKNPLKGNGLILNECDYKRLEIYTNILISECKVPVDIIPMPKTNLTNQTIVYTFSLIHDSYITGRETTKEYIVFIHKVFTQFKDNNVEKGNNYRSTTAYKKFRDETYNYKRLINS